MKVLAMNLSGVCEGYWPSEITEVLDLKEIPGTNCYLDPLAKVEIRKHLSAYPLEGVHLLDSGNYHYLSLLWMEKAEQDFALVLFDNHPDMQAPSFGEITSCGGWVREALLTLPHLKRVYLLGAEEELVEEDVPPLLDELREAGKNMEEDVILVPGPREELSADMLGEILSAESLPLYLSVDKDVLSPEDASCNWSQGILRLSTLCKMLRRIYEEHEVLGLDICGEADPNGEDAAKEKNARATGALLKEAGNDHE